MEDNKFTMGPWQSVCSWFRDGSRCSWLQSTEPTPGLRGRNLRELTWSTSSGADSDQRNPEDGLEFVACVCGDAHLRQPGDVTVGTQERALQRSWLWRFR